MKNLFRINNFVCSFRSIEIVVHNIFVMIALWNSLRSGKKGSTRSFQVIAASAEIPDDSVLKIVLKFYFDETFATFLKLKKSVTKIIM